MNDAPRANSVGGLEALELLEPVLHQDEGRRRAAPGLHLASTDDEEPSVGGKVAITLSVGDAVRSA